MVKFLKKLWAFVLSFIPEGRYKYIDEYIDEDFEICTSTSYICTGTLGGIDTITVGKVCFTQHSLVLKIVGLNYLRKI